MNHFPIVVVGASAGGLEAFTELLKHLPKNTGMGFVFIQHLDPTHKSVLVDLLSKNSSLPVIEIKNNMGLKPNTVFIIPQNKDLILKGRTFELSDRTKSEGLFTPINTFFNSLDEEQKSSTIGVILSGTGTDGTFGLRQIKAAGGITFSQDTESAKFDGMPKSAITSGYVDFILPPKDIAVELGKISQHPLAFDNNKNSEDASESKDVSRQENKDLAQIFKRLNSVSGVDFSYYKLNTIKRRISRRLILHKIKNLSDYVEFIRNNKKEVEKLYYDLLISVTNFFREPEIFEILAKEVFPKIIDNASPDNPVRIWVPGCSTGEEAYSIAIALMDLLEKKSRNIPIQIFATDISEISIEKARAGYYPETIMSDVPKERLKKYFEKKNGGYQINSSIREMCIFAKQDIAKDPPFSKLDLISCRNLLIYLTAEAQKKIIPIFHYALKQDGYLVLGSSESISGFNDLFTSTGKRNKFYQKVLAAKGLAHKFDYSKSYSKYIPEKKNTEFKDTFNLQKEADKIVLEEFSPSGLILNNDLEIIQFRGNISQYLNPSEGNASFNLFKMIKEELTLEMHSAIGKAKKSNKVISSDEIEIKINDKAKKINIKVVPISDDETNKKFFLILFDEKGEKIKIKSKPSSNGKDKDQLNKLKKELTITKQHLQSIAEGEGAVNEELHAALEELQSSNEELQSTNEEMETAKEELQSTNEELITVNEELENKNIELNTLNNDLVNLLSSVEVPIVMIGRDLKIRRYTPKAEAVWNLIPGDIGRPLADINPNIDLPYIEEEIHKVMDKLEVKDLEVKDKNSSWFSMRIRPYKTIENKIDGVVISLIDINDMKKDLKKVTKSRDFLEVLIREIHHRVKNNLQLVTSLLNLQANTLDDERIKSVLTEAKDRVKSMAIIHEKLYGANNFTEINLSDYIKDLAKSLIESYQTDSRNIHFSVKEIDFNINMDTAINIGLIINELLTNSIKYAFPIKTNKEPEINFNITEDKNKLEITIGDNGIGIPENINFENTNSLGLQLVTILTEQIKGTIELHNDNGAKFVLSVNKEYIKE